LRFSGGIALLELRPSDMVKGMEDRDV